MTPDRLTAENLTRAMAARTDPSVSQQAIEEVAHAFAGVARDETLTQGHVTEALQWLSSIDTMVDRRAGETGSHWDAEPTPDPPPAIPVYLRATTPIPSTADDERISAIMPTIERIRRRYWRSTEAPFPHDAYHEEGAPWLEETLKNWTTPTQEEVDRRNELHEQGWALADEATALTGDYYSFDPQDVVLEFVRADRRHDRRWFGRRHQIYDFGMACRTIARATGFLGWQIPPLILCGVEPTFPRAAIKDETNAFPERLPDGTRFAQGAGGVVVRFQAPDITLKELHEVYRLVRKAWAVEKDDGARVLEGDTERTVVTEQDARMYQILVELDGLGDGRKPHRFWDRVKKKWDERSDTPASKHALTMKGKRLLEKVKEIDTREVYTTPSDPGAEK